jgi:hypothetical protein
VSLNGSQHCLPKGAPNRNPEHEHKRSAPNQQDAGNNPAMPTAKFGTSKFCHWFRGPDSRNRVPASQIETRKGKWSTHLIVNLRKVKMISFQSAWHPRPANSPIPAYAQTPVDDSPLEGDEFEPSVPWYKRCFLTLPIRWLGAPGDRFEKLPRDGISAIPLWRS